MAEFDWTPGSPLDAEAVTARLGRLDGEAGVTLREIRDLDLALVACRRGAWAELEAAAMSRFGVAPPSAPLVVSAADALLVWSGPGQFLVFGERRDEPLAAGLAGALATIASVSDQSDARCLLGIGGARAKDMLAKLLSIDLDDLAFPAGSAAATAMDHVPVSFWRGPDDPAIYRLLCPASYAGSIWRAVAEAGAEFGVDADAVPFTG